MIKIPHADMESIVRQHEARISKVQSLFIRPLFDSLEFIVQNGGLRRLASSLGGTYFATYQVRSKVVLCGRKAPLTPREVTTFEPCCGGHGKDIDAMECLRKQGIAWYSVYCKLPGLAMLEALPGGWKIIDRFFEEEDQFQERRAA